MFGVTQAHGLTVSNEEQYYESYIGYCGYVEMTRTSKDKQEWTKVTVCGME